MTQRLLVSVAAVLAAAPVVGCRDESVAPRSTAAVVVVAGPSAARGVVPGRYVVLFRRGRVAASPFTVDELAGRKLVGGRGVLRRTFSHALQGFAAQLSDSGVAALRRDPDVALVAPDPVVHVADDGIETGGPWGLDRIDQRWLPLDAHYHFAGDGAGATVYIVDTGINLTHTEFGGRAVAGVDYVTPGGAAADCNGHGTHVAGIVGGTTYGVAKRAQLVAVRVLDCSGSGDGSSVIAALDWVVQRKATAPATPMVVNMSLTGDAAAVIDSAVERTVAAGVSVVVAAGNASVDACTTSPARAPNAITVAATDASDNFASFSNFGACVDLAAPGVGIVSAYIGSPTATATLSGTSMASPHVAGAAALYLATYPTATPTQVATALLTNAVGGPLQGVPAGTTARLLDVEFLAGRTPVPGDPTALRSAAAPLCVDVPAGARSNGTRVRGWTCAGSDTQRFLVPAVGATGLIRASNGLCLDAVQGGTTNGEPVALWTCNGWVHQRWTVTAGGQILDATTGLCLDLAGGGTANGTHVLLWTCHGSSNQRWVTTHP